MTGGRGAYALLIPFGGPRPQFTGWVCDLCHVRRHTPTLEAAQRDIREHNRRHA